MLSAAEEAHRALLEKWRHAMDLVGPGPLLHHFVDARAAVGWLATAGVWADLGSGAGFPGVALALHHPDVRVDLVESRRKRAAFLEQVLGVTGADNARVLCTRSETLQDETYDGVISRAYRPPAKFLADAHRLLVPGGCAVLLAAGGTPPTVEGLRVFHVERYLVEGKNRLSVGYRKAG